MKKLIRKEENSLFGGVCSGLGDYLNISPWIIRLLIILFYSEIVVVAYVLMWTLIDNK